MPQLSEKGKIMPASPIRKLVPYADAAKKRGVKVYLSSYRLGIKFLY